MVAPLGIPILYWGAGILAGSTALTAEDIWNSITGGGNQQPDTVLGRLGVSPLLVLAVVVGGIYAYEKADN